MNQIDTMKLALETLEYWDVHGKLHQPTEEAITALREALAEQSAQGCNHCNHSLYAGTKCKNCGRVTKQAAIKRDLTPEQPAQQEPTVENNSQNWRGMDGTTAYWLIQRHADGWSDIGKMMGEWLEANQTQAREPLTDADLGVYISKELAEYTKGWYADLGFAKEQLIYFARAIEAAHGIKEKRNESH